MKKKFNYIVYVLETPHNWRDIIKVTVKHVAIYFLEVQFHFKEGTEYIKETINYRLKDEEKKLSSDYLNKLLRENFTLEPEILDYINL